MNLVLGRSRSMRHEVDQLLLALWADPACKTSLVALAKDGGSGAATADDASGGVLVDYARAVLNDLMYLLKVLVVGNHSNAAIAQLCLVTPALSSIGKQAPMYSRASLYGRGSIR